MKRGITIAAIVVYLGVTVGCMLLGGGRDAAVAADRNGGSVYAGVSSERAAALPLRGVAMQLQRVDWMDTEYRKSIEEIAAIGADTVLFVVDSHMENGTSSAIYLDMRLVPSIDQLGRIVDYAHGKKLRVVLMPIVLLDHPRGNEWRGTIKPESWSDWWDSYRAMLRHFSWVAEAHKVDVLVVGSELVSTESKAEEWATTIGEVRQRFKGMITYSSNWDHYKDIPFWNQLDLIGMNSYWKLGKDHNVSVGEIEQNWAKIRDGLMPFIHSVGKPLVFLEVGWCSMANAAHEPWDYTKTEEPIDLDLQKRLYEGFFQSWYGVAELGGYMTWEWPPGDGGSDNRGYTPENKPAEKVMREWLAKEPWKVK